MYKHYNLVSFLQTLKIALMLAGTTVEVYTFHHSEFIIVSSYLKIQLRVFILQYSQLGTHVRLLVTGGQTLKLTVTALLHKFFMFSYTSLLL